MHKFAPLIVVGILLVALVAVFAWGVQSDSEELDDLLADLKIGDSSSDETGGSGFLEAEDVTLSSQLTGRVQSVEVAEGDEVEDGDVLVVLDASQVEAQIKRAEAAVAAAESQLEGLRQGARDEQIRQAEAALSQAEAVHSGAEQSLRDALSALGSPSQLNLGIDAAGTAADVAEQQVVAAEARLKAAEQLLAQAESAASAAGLGTAQQAAQARESLRQAEDLALQAQMDVAMAKVDRDYAIARLALLKENKDSPLDLEAAVDAARSSAHGAAAAVAAAQAQLELAKAGPTLSQLRLAEAGLAQAEAQLRMLQVQQALAEVASPIDGSVLAVYADVGEAVSPGTPLATVAELSPLVITIYISETDIGELEIGQSAEVTVDAYDDEVFDGEVVNIASKAEFTPKNVQTNEDRANLVYAVLVRVDNDGGDLKPGMPADVTIDTD
jgi:multidrug resistance efflux pump